MCWVEHYLDLDLVPACVGNMELPGAVMIIRGAEVPSAIALGPQLVCVSGGFRIVARVPGGAKGTGLKSWGPLSTW